MTIPTFPHQLVTTLQFPYSFVTTTILLPNPEFNNSERISRTRIQRETRGGDLETFADDIWPIDDELAWTFNNITLSQRDDLASFLELTLGQEIKVIDHEGMTWKAIITNPEAEFVQDGNDDCDTGRFTISLVLNAELISWL